MSVKTVHLKIALYIRGFDESYRVLPYNYDGKNYIWNENTEVFNSWAMVKRWAKKEGFKLLKGDN